jgi:hypothetical protein
MPVKAVVATGLALLAGLALVLMLGQAERRSGSNYVPEQGPVTELRGAAERCQDGELVPGDTGALKLLVGTYGRPTPEITVTVTGTSSEHAFISTGRLRAGEHEGHVVIPVGTIDKTVSGARVCIRTGPGGRTVLYGRGDKLRLAWLRPGSESRLAMLSTVAHRFGLAKLNPFGPWLLAVAALVLAAAWFAALRLVLREVGS